MSRSDRSVVLLGWLVAGTADIAAALTYYPWIVGAARLRILQGIAAGVLGAHAFDGGDRTAALGLALHYLIALVWTLIFWRLARLAPVLLRHLFATGVLYGLVVWAGMNLIVLPASRVRHGPFNLHGALVAATILVICIGLPLAFIVGRHVRREM